MKKNYLLVIIQHIRETNHIVREDHIFDWIKRITLRVVNCHTTEKNFLPKALIYYRQGGSFYDGRAFKNMVLLAVGRSQAQNYLSLAPHSALCTEWPSGTRQTLKKIIRVLLYMTLDMYFFTFSLDSCRKFAEALLQQ